MIHRHEGQANTGNPAIRSLAEAIDLAFVQLFGRHEIDNARDLLWLEPQLGLGYLPHLSGEPLATEREWQPLAAQDNNGNVRGASVQ